MSEHSELLNLSDLVGVLNLTKTATAIHIGETAIIQYANDEMLKIWGKSREVIGKSLEDALPELKGQPFIDMFARVWREGLIINGTDTPADLIIDGVLTTFYFDFEYRAVKNEAGKVIATLHSAVDVTDRYLKKEAIIRVQEKEEALLREQSLNEELAATNEELNATNEELHLNKEELKSLNEELEERVNSRVKDLKESEERFRTMAEGTDILIAVGDETSNATYFNKAWTKLTGRNMNKLLSFGWVDLVHPEDKDKYVTTYLSAFEKRKPFTGEFRVLNKEGNYRWLYAQGPPRFRPDGSFAGYISSAVDITDRKENELEKQELAEELAVINEEMAASNEELLVSNEELVGAQNLLGEALSQLTTNETKLRHLILDAPIAIALLQGKEMIIETANTKILEIWGKEPTVIGKPILEALPELIGQPFPKLLDEVFASGIPYHGNEAKALLENQEIYVNFVYQPIKDKDGITDSLLITAMDVTEQVISRKKVEEAETAMRLAINAANFGTWHIHSVTRKFITSSRLKELFGYYPDEELSIDGALAQITEEYRDFVSKKLELAIAGDGDYDVTYPVVGYHDHVLRWLRAIGNLKADESGAFASFTGVVMDITAQVLASKKIEQAEENLRMAIDAAEMGTYSINAESLAFVISDRFKVILGFWPDENPTLQDCFQQIREDFRGLASEMVENSLKRGDKFELEYPVIGIHDGKERWIRGLGELIYDGTKTQSFFTGVIIDVSERVRDEQRKNDFIGMVSHELKTPITSLKAYLQLLQKRAQKADDSFTTNALDKSVKQVKKMTTMINDFLNVSRLESGKIHIDKQTFDMAELMKDTADESITLFSSHEIIFSPIENAVVLADRDKIGQVINNIIGNAAKYSDQGSTIYVSCVQKDDVVEVCVKDKGIGIASHDLSLMFERYYRVDNNDNISGFGIGLYLSSEIIKLHHGEIWAQSEIGKGSSFYFTLPLTTA
ncbi:MAG: PAS domain S-box protein [Pedobacter sp.]|nr:MAG: PAS domain S-box protein [Pedobacter sp.]